MTELRIPAGETLVKEGFGTAQFFVIQDGRASVSRDGKEIAQIGPGDVIGEISIIDGGARTATVTALTDMTVDVATHGEFSGLLDRAPRSPCGCCRPWRGAFARLDTNRIGHGPYRPKTGTESRNDAQRPPFTTNV